MHRIRFLFGEVRKCTGYRMDSEESNVSLTLLGAEVKAAAGATVSLSAMTLTHDMAKLLLVEQVYRACTILKGGKYHHGD